EGPARTGGGDTTTGGPAKSPKPGRPKKTETRAAAGCGVASAKRPRNVIARIVFFMGLPPASESNSGGRPALRRKGSGTYKVRTGERQWLWTGLPSQPASYGVRRVRPTMRGGVRYLRGTPRGRADGSRAKPLRLGHRRAVPARG